MGFGDMKTDPTVFGNPNLKPENSVEYVNRKTYEHRARELIKCRNDIVYFAENYFTIVNLDIGKQIIKLYPKQKEFLENLRDNNRVVCLASRQSGKTTTYAIYTLWLTIFHEDQKVLISANKQDTALEILSRIRLAFEHLPNWLKCGIKIWNKGQIVFSNDSSIEGVATSSSSARGKSVNVLVIDECAIIPQNIMDEFYNAVYPIVSSSKKSKVIMVSTPKGIGNIFYKTYETARLGVSEDGWKSFRIDWWDVPGRDEDWHRKTLASLNYDETAFAQEFGNAFLGSSYTLVKSEVIKKYKDFAVSKNWFEPELIPLEQIGRCYKRWFKSQKDHAYIAACDVSDGVGKDSSVILILDVTDPFNIVVCASYGSNTLGTIEMAYMLAKMCQEYNGALVAAEANAMGRALLDPMESLYCHENIVSHGNEKSGFMSHVQMKAAACLWFRSLTSYPEFNISPFEKNSVAEMEYFEKKMTKDNHNVYEASGNNHDDYIMALIWGVYCLIEQICENYFICEGKIPVGGTGQTLPKRIKPYSSGYYSLDEDERMVRLRAVDPDFAYSNLKGAPKSEYEREFVPNNEMPRNLGFLEGDEWTEAEESWF